MQEQNITVIEDWGFAQVFDDYQFQLPNGSEESQGAFIGVGQTRCVSLRGLRDRLPYDLSRIKSGDKRGTIQYLKKFGFLGYSALGLSQSSDTNTERAEFIWAHATTITHLLAVNEALKSGDDQAVQEVIDDLTSPSIHSDSEGHQHPTWWFQSGAIQQSLMPYGFGNRPAVQAAKEMVETAINSNISYRVAFNLHRIDDAANANYSFGVEWNTILNLTYYTLATHFSLGKQVRRCQLNDCGAFFLSKHRGRKFCPPRPGTKQSQCARRYYAKNPKGS
jgi:hypothetical protein